MSLKHILSGVFGAGVAFRNGLYDSHRLRVNQLRGPVVSIGNISVGGSGKTPFTFMLGSLLKQRGISFDIISRGYRRETSGTMIVNPAGSARQFGDEPLLMARELGVDVVVGEDRYEAGLLAERTWGPRLHLLDDAFQHRRLARQFDIVLLSPEDVDDALLPSGRLREPLSALSRADAIVITDDTLTSKLPPQLPRWHLRRDLYLDYGNGSPANDSSVVFCGIAKPAKFFEQVRALGITPAAEVSFRDHHRYSAADVRRLGRIAELRHAYSFITTAKDAINLEVLGSEMRGRRLCIARLKLTLDDSDSALDSLLSTLAQRGKPAS